MSDQLQTYPCPACGASATLSANCSGCGRAPDPNALRVWQLNEELVGLAAEERAARAAHFVAYERLAAAQAERNARAAEVRASVAATRAGGTGAAPAVPEPAPAMAAPAQREVSPRTIQNLLFILGGILLGTAAIVFAAVAWVTFSTNGRAAILAGVTVLLLALPVVAVRRGLRATAETFAALALLFLVLDGYAAWYVDLFALSRHLSGTRFAAIVFAITALISLGYRGLTKLTAATLAALLAAQPVGPLLAAGHGYGQARWSAILLGVAGLNVLLLLVVRRRSVLTTIFVSVLVAAWLLPGSLTLLAVAVRPSSGPNRHWLVAVFALAGAVYYGWAHATGIARPAGAAIAVGLIEVGVVREVVLADIRLRYVLAAAVVGVAAIAMTLVRRRRSAAAPVDHQLTAAWSVTVAFAGLSTLAVAAIAVAAGFSSAWHGVPWWHAEPRTDVWFTGQLLAVAAVLGATVAATAPGPWRWVAVCGTAAAIALLLPESVAVRWWVPIAVTSAMTAVLTVVAVRVSHLSILQRWLIGAGAGGLGAVAFLAGQGRPAGTLIATGSILATGLVATAVGRHARVLSAAALAAAILVTPFVGAALVRVVRPAASADQWLRGAAAAAILAAVALAAASRIRLRRVAFDGTATGSDEATVEAAVVSAVAAGDVAPVGGAPAGPAVGGASAGPAVSGAPAVGGAPAGTAVSGAPAGGGPAVSGGPAGGAPAGGGPAVSGASTGGAPAVSGAAAGRGLVAGGPVTVGSPVAIGGSAEVGRPAGVGSAGVRGRGTGLDRVAGLHRRSGVVAEVVVLTGIGLLAELGGFHEPRGVYPAVAVLVILALTAVYRWSLAAWAATVPALTTLIVLGSAVESLLGRPYDWTAHIWAGAPDGVGLAYSGRGWTGRPQDYLPLAILAVAGVAVGAIRRNATLAAAIAWLPAVLAVLSALAAQGAQWPAVAAVTLGAGLVAAVVVTVRAQSEPATWLGLVGAAVLAGPGLAGMLATRPATLIGLGLTAVTGVVVAGLAVQIGVRMAASVIAAAALLTFGGAVPAAVDAPAHRAALGVLVAAVVLLFGALWNRLGPESAVVTSLAAHTGALIALLTALPHLGYAAVVAMIWGLAVALRSLTRGANRVLYLLIAAGCELIAWWLLLANRGIGTLEAYTGPAAAIALGAGWLLGRGHPEWGSWRKYGVALAVGFAPSVAALIVHHAEPGRRLLLGLAALATFGFGAATKQRAFFVAGSAVTIVVALNELVLLWDKLPRWIPLGLAGILVLAVATSYEWTRSRVRQLRHDVAQMH